MMNEELKNLEVAVMAHKEGRLHDAENMYRAILESNPLQADANHNLGLIACAVGKPELSLPLFEVALKAHPTHEQYLNSYIDALISSNNYHSTETHISDSNKSEYNFKLKIIIKLFNSGKFQDVLDYGLKHKMILCKDIYFYKIMSESFKKCNLILDAINILKECIETIGVNLIDAEVYNCLGSCYQKNNDLFEAKINYKKAILKNDKIINAYENLCVLYLLEQDYT
jgi:tetratricopeptide (TPR) repeat protein